MGTTEASLLIVAGALIMVFSKPIATSTMRRAPDIEPGSHPYNRIRVFITIGELVLGAVLIGIGVANLV